uniref:Uncharacterized protein n=1 Tax=Corethron hystrix TaxID=216773 RepID=A0A7S1BKV3_9STRA|mmetsp:Transcript_3232/g.5957  ORF Transcript_3232/g.5957 Transcript_3232/m.5957 type:complete len:166 (+) Transcript_3232:122-619(+)
MAVNNDCDPEASSDDEWDKDEIDLPTIVLPTVKGTSEKRESKDDDSGWFEPVSAISKNSAEATIYSKMGTENKDGEGEPMLIVDFTDLTDGKIHSKHDKNSVNDPDAASSLRKKIEASYETYRDDTKLLSSGTIRPCGSTVWRSALIALRDERRGHYFCPVFPPK